MLKINDEDRNVINTNAYSEYDDNEDIPFYEIYSFLYHGLRFQKYLEKLEGIFKERKILAGKYVKGYYNYSDNCNRGEFVSLLNRAKTDHVSFATFIEENITLLVSPRCGVIETKYVSYDTWLKVKDLDLKQIYSYMPGEYLCKDFVPLEYVKAVAVPYKRYVRIMGQEYADKVLEDIKLLMEKYDISLPIIDVSYNMPITKTISSDNSAMVKRLTL